MDINNTYKNEESIDIKEICWRLLEQWKAIIIVAVCVAAVFLGFMHFRYVKASKEESEIQQEQQQVTSQEIIDSLSEDEQTVVSSAYLMLQKREQFSDFIKESPIMKLDPNHAKRIRVSWTVDSQDKTDLVMNYMVGLESENCKDALQRACGTDYKAEYFSDLINISYPNQTDMNLVCYDIFLTDDMQAEVIQEALKNQISLIHDNLQRTFGEHQIINYQSEISIVADQNLYSKQTTALNSFASINNQINNLKNSFSASEEKAFAKLQEKEKRKEIDEQPQVKPRAVTPINIVIGLILGICMYAILFFLFSVLSNRVISSTVLKETSVRSLGEWYSFSDPKKKPLVCDGFVWRKHHSKHLDREDEINSITNTIKSICGFKQIRSLLLVLTASCTKEQESFVRAVSEKLELQGIQAELMNINMGRNEFDDSKLAATEGVVLAIFDSKTKAKDISFLFDRCNDYKKPIVGSVYLG